jgi:hypothetical protein
LAVTDRRYRITTTLRHLSDFIANKIISTITSGGYIIRPYAQICACGHNLMLDKICCGRYFWVQNLGSSVLHNK